MIGCVVGHLALAALRNRPASKIALHIYTQLQQWPTATLLAAPAILCCFFTISPTLPRFNSAGAAEITSLQSSQSFTTDCHLRSYLWPTARLNPPRPSCRDGELQFTIPKSPKVSIYCEWHSRELADCSKFLKRPSESEGETLGGYGMLSLNFYPKGNHGWIQFMFRFVLHGTVKGIQAQTENGRTKLPAARQQRLALSFPPST